jgi:hypothetical protein
MSTPTLLAWEVEIDCQSCVVFALTASKARWLAVKAYWDAFGRTRSWPHCSVGRRPFYDKFPFKNERKAFTPEYVRSLC